VCWPFSPSVRVTPYPETVTTASAATVPSSSAATGIGEARVRPAAR
jgi:hypothetical protein